ncbi:hypothetical protein DND132_3133 [Pseudodesulfovibrio mercurii]|uniref:Uncharacterized protein n=1 Tax=Pseudodesulfovibrio mercurii TaxID=641491 RepID=F0JK87_9BACT|nr:hypothetical protein [Pseudodesulfovibrio mercurii]EGB16336.1 hypothetical protein DND132_3133 [Pseudodesulfovibrio mercurii]
MNTSVPCIRLHLPAEAAWAGLVQAAAKQAGAVFGLDSAKTMRLAHCSEELLLFLSSAKAGEIEATLRPIATGAEIRFSFSSSGVNLSAMNLTYVHDTKSEECDLTCLPLLLASRMTDGFKVGLEGLRMEIVLRVDKVYPEPAPLPAERVRVQGTPVFSPAVDTDTLFEACGTLAGLYPGHLVPEWCASPGRTSDLVRGGELFATEARDAAGRLCGIIFWKMRSEQSVTFFGPYDFSTDGSVADGLTNALLQTVGRSRAKNVFSSLSTLPLSDHGFELLANLPYRLTDSPDPVTHSVWGRMLQEDFGAAVWAHEDFADFLRGRYDSLEMVRDLRPVHDFGETIPDASVIGACLTPGLSEAFLHPELNGADIGDNLARHVASLSSSGYRNILFEIDLAKGWHAALGGPLKQCGFRPVLMLPHGGQSDTLIFRHDPEA